VWLKLSKIRNACQKHSKFAAALQIQHGAPVFIPSDTLLPLSLIRLCSHSQRRWLFDKQNYQKAVHQVQTSTPEPHRCGVACCKDCFLVNFLCIEFFTGREQGMA
jgi:hypothetical protein